MALEMSSFASTASGSRAKSSASMTAKYRHMHGVESKWEETFYSLLPDLSAIDDPIISCNERYFALPYRGGGGPVYVSRLSDVGKVLPECGVLNGHKSQILRGGLLQP